MVVRTKKKGAVTFVCNVEPNASRIYLATSANCWDPTAERMTRVKDGSFRATLLLPAGEYQYKFVIDGIWINDPDAEGQTINCYGTLNSLVRVQ